MANSTIFGDLLRGNTDKILLSILIRQDSYGYRVNKTLEDESGGRFTLNEATLYTTFKRLETDGLIESYWKEETLAPARKYYKVTAAGKDYFERSKSEWEEAISIMNHFILRK